MSAWFPARCRAGTRGGWLTGRWPGAWVSRQRLRPAWEAPAREAPAREAPAGALPQMTAAGMTAAVAAMAAGRGAERTRAGPRRGPGGRPVGW